MINYRNIFNPNYNYIGIIIIILLLIAIFILQKNTISSLIRISNMSLISGIIILIIAITINMLIKILVLGSYKIFIEVITNTIIKNLYFYSITIIIISIILNILIKFIPSSNQTPKI